MKVFSVTEFLSLVNETLKALSEYESFAVEGEVSGYRVNQGQWVTFDLKDGESVVNVFLPIWKQKTALTDGMQIRVTGAARVYAKYGKFSISADTIELVGEGALRKALALLRSRLEKEGLFDIRRKREIVRFPRRIALIASRDSAAYGDFIRIAGERWPLLYVDLYHVLVQGEKAPSDIRTAMREAETRHGTHAYDALVITRGGGSFEELMAFNDESLVRDIFASKIPTLVAVGHERDLTLAEEAADIRGSTPTDAARRLVPDHRDIEYEISAMSERIGRHMDSAISETYRLIDLVLTRSVEWMRSTARQIDILASRTAEGMRRFQTTFSERLDLTVRLLQSLDPAAVLKRGYALVTDLKGAAITSVKRLSRGQGIQVRMKDGTAGATVSVTSE
jgi:exodeoxyribonuclease VII large subunit